MGITMLFRSYIIFRKSWIILLYCTPMTPSFFSTITDSNPFTQFTVYTLDPFYPFNGIDPRNEFDITTSIYLFDPFKHLSRFESIRSHSLQCLLDQFDPYKGIDHLAMQIKPGQYIYWIGSNICQFDPIPISRHEPRCEFIHFDVLSSSFQVNLGLCSKVYNDAVQFNASLCFNSVNYAHRANWGL